MAQSMSHEKWAKNLVEVRECHDPMQSRVYGYYLGLRGRH